MLGTVMEWDFKQRSKDIFLKGFNSVFILMNDLEETNISMNSAVIEICLQAGILSYCKLEGYRFDFHLEKWINFITSLW